MDAKLLISASIVFNLVLIIMQFIEIRRLKAELERLLKAELERRS